ncbi:MAG: transglutaminase family protein [Acidimicrobiales bacterium]|nr:transglutaminase family protein [Acidimicrobiales bacterium]
MISHATTYTYSTPVRHGLQELRLRPVSGPSQSVLGWDTEIEGGTHQLLFDDEYGNRVELIRLTPGSTETVVTARGEVETEDVGGVISSHIGYAPIWLFQRSTPHTEIGAGIRDLCGELPETADEVTLLHELSAAVGERVDYRPGHSDVATTAEDALVAGVGVCQDHAHAFIAAARHLGYPARYVSGYLLLGASDQQDASHAWAEVWLDGLGWVGFDVSNGISPDGRYVRIATGLDYRAAAPIKGLRYGSGDEALHVELEVRAEWESGQQQQRSP